MIRIFVVVVALGCATSVAGAQAMPYFPSMTCQQAAALVRASGVIVAGTGPHTYDRFVTEDISCEPDADAAPAFEPTLNNRQCFVGYYCREKETESK